MVRQHGIRKTILIAVSIAVLVTALILVWIFPMGAQKQSVSDPSISYDLGFLGIGTDLDIPLEQFHGKTYTILSDEDDLISLLQALKSNCEHVYVDGEPVAKENPDWDKLFQDVLSSNLFANDHKVLAVNVWERYGGAADFDAVLRSCYVRGSRAWVNVQTQERSASTAAFHGAVFFIPCPKEISSVQVHIDRSIESANAE